MDFYSPPSLQGVLYALATVYRALRARKFYPKGHPSRKSSLNQAHTAMLTLLNGYNLSLSCKRTGFSFSDGELIKDATRMSASLSNELFIRRVKKITFLADLYKEDLLELFRILSILPETIQKAGGMDKLMAEHGIRTIWVNELELSIILGRRRDVESSGVTPHGVDELEDNTMGEESENSPFPDFQIAELGPEEELQALLARLATVMDEERYLTLVRQAITCAEILKARHVLTPLLPMAKLLSTHAVDASRSENLIECARFGVEQLSMGDEFIFFLFDRMEKSDEVSSEFILAILTVAGTAALSLAVEKMGSIDKMAVRKKLSTLIVKLGEPAVPSLLAMLEDSRWYIVRSLVTILGDIGSPTAVPGLLKCLPHADIRVGKEAIRSLAKIGGKEAEAAIISIVRDNNHSLLPQAFTSLGGMKSKKALWDLMYIIHSEDMFLKTLSFKTSALIAISLIGDQHVTPNLVKLLEKRHLIARRRWEQFRIAVALCLSKLGDTRALPVLRKMAGTSGELGQVCAEAATSIERTGGSPHGGA